MPVNAPDDDDADILPRGIIPALRYVLCDAWRDMSDAVVLGRQRQAGKLSREEFASAIDRRFNQPEAMQRP